MNQNVLLTYEIVTDDIDVCVTHDLAINIQIFLMGRSSVNFIQVMTHQHG